MSRKPISRPPMRPQAPISRPPAPISRPPMRRPAPMSMPSRRRFLKQISRPPMRPPARRRFLSCKYYRGPVKDEIVKMSYGYAMVHLISEQRPRVRDFFTVRKAMLEKDVLESMRPIMKQFYIYLNRGRTSPVHVRKKKALPFVRSIWL